jgi:hypothetical protein
MPKLIVINPRNEQEIIDIHPSGGYYDSSKILFDERIEGELPQNLIDGLGGISKVKGQYQIDQAAALTFAQSKINKQNEIAAKRSKAINALNDVLNTDETKVMSALEVQTALKAVVKYLKNKEI